MFQLLHIRSKFTFFMTLFNRVSTSASGGACVCLLRGLRLAVLSVRAAVFIVFVQVQGSIQALKYSQYSALDWIHLLYWAVFIQTGPEKQTHSSSLSDLKYHLRGFLLFWYLTLSIIYLDIVTSVGLGRAFRNCRTAEMSLSISSSVLMWWGSSTESQVNPAWCTWVRTNGKRRVEAEKNCGEEKEVSAFTHIDTVRTPSYSILRLLLY